MDDEAVPSVPDLFQRTLAAVAPQVALSSESIKLTVTVVKDEPPSFKVTVLTVTSAAGSAVKTNTAISSAALEIWPEVVIPVASEVTVSLVLATVIALTFVAPSPSGPTIVTASEPPADKAVTSAAFSILKV